MYYFKIKYKNHRRFKTLRCRSTISAIFSFLVMLPFSSLKDIVKIHIERID